MAGLPPRVGFAYREAQRHAILDQVAVADPGEGLDLMWRFVALANSVFARCDDSSGTVSSIFDAACRDLGALAHAANASSPERQPLRNSVPGGGFTSPEISTGGHVASSRNDRFCTKAESVEAISPCGASPCRVRKPRRGDPGLWRFRAARSL